MATDDVNASERVRLRLRDLIKSRPDLTGRELGRRLDHGDQWASNLLAGKHSLSLDDLDKAAAYVKVPASALVAAVDEEAWMLGPTEQRLIRSVRALPLPLRDHLVTLAEYLQGVTPDEIDLLRKVRRLLAVERTRVEHWIDVTLTAQGTERAPRVPPDPAAVSAAGGSPTQTIKPVRRRK